MTKNEVVKKEETQNLPKLAGNTSLDAAKAIAEELSKSDIIPKEFQKKPANCLIAVELSNRLKASPFQVMQNMDVIYGRPALRSSFVIACINNSGKIIGSLKFELDEKVTKCRAWAIEKETNSRLTGPTITLEMAEKEGWLTKNGSKWKTMPDLMLRYRAASFFGRLYCPEILNGMLTDDEARDISNEPEDDGVIDVFAEPKVQEKNTTPENFEIQQKLAKGEVDPKLEELADKFYEEYKDEINS